MTVLELQKRCFRNRFRFPDSLPLCPDKRFAFAMGGLGRGVAQVSPTKANPADSGKTHSTDEELARDAFAP
jgi:hypothetical protein